MKKTQIFMLFLAQLMLAVGFSPASAEEQDTVLMVVSSYGKERGELQPGYEFDEFAKAYLVFRDHGFAVDIASPAGGAVEADKYDPDKPYNRMVLADAYIMDKLNNTLPTSVVDPDNYLAVFVVGGKGAMFDLPGDTDLQEIIATLYEDERVVSAVCHGPAALVNVRLSSGEYLVSGRRVNGFTNTEEQVFGKKWMQEFPFMLEDKLIERGGRFENSEIMLSHVAEDARLITGQNPFSTSDVASAVVRALGADPLPQQRFTDDATMALVARVLAGDDKALGQLRFSPADYQIELVGMYGYYYLDQATEQGQIKHAVMLMEAANETMQHPALSKSIVKGYSKLGQRQLALKKAQQLAEAMPNDASVLALLASLEAS